MELQSTLFDNTKEKLPEAKLAYYAGLFDGEGHISLYRPNVRNRETYELRAIITLKEGPEVLNELKQSFRGSIHTTRSVRYWTVTGREAGYFLEQVYPYFRVKRKQAELALDYYKEYCRIAPGRFSRGYQVPAFLIRRGQEIKEELENLRPKAHPLRGKRKREKKYE